METSPLFRHMPILEGMRPAISGVCKLSPPDASPGAARSGRDSDLAVGEATNCGGAGGEGEHVEV